MEWYRMYHGMPFDTKLRVVAKRSGQPMGLVVAVWACLLDAASSYDPRGIAEVDPEEIAVALDFEMEAIEAILTAMQDKEMIDEDGYLTAWDKRQQTTSTERSRKSRARNKEKSDAAYCNSMQRDATPRNATQRKNSKKPPDKDKDDEDGYLTAWDKRQQTTSTERSRKSRTREKSDAAYCNTMQRDATPRNATQRKNSKKTTRYRYRYRLKIKIIDNR